MARAQMQDMFGNLLDQEEDYGGGGSAGTVVPPTPDSGIGPVSGGSGNTERPTEIPGPGRDTPPSPPDVRPRSPGGPSPSQGGGGQPSGGGGGGDYTPARPKAPAPIAAQPPIPFTPMPGADPGALTTAMRAPYIPEPISQYGGDPNRIGPGGRSEGLVGGGLGVGGGDGFEDLAEGDPLDALIRILMNGQA